MAGGYNGASAATSAKLPRHEQIPSGTPMLLGRAHCSPGQQCQPFFTCMVATLMAMRATMAAPSQEESPDQRKIQAPCRSDAKGQEGSR